MAHRYRLMPTLQQTEMLFTHCEHARVIWNTALEQMNMYRPNYGPTPRFNEQAAQLTEARAAFGWLADGSTMVQQQALRDFDQAMTNWWRGSHGRPTWRNRYRHNGFRVVSLTVSKIDRKWATIYIPKLGPVKFRLSRPLPKHDVKSARITLDRSGRWHVSLTAPQPAVSKESTGAAIGLDMGVIHTVTTSDGDHLDMPSLLSLREQARRLRLQRKFARQLKGSNRREATRLSAARLSACEVDRRNDWIEKTTTQLVREYDVIAIEDLKIKNMVRSAKGTIDKPGVNVAQKRGLNRSISNQGWGNFRLRLEQKAEAATSPCVVVAVNPVNTSRCCYQCGHISSKNRRNQSLFCCIKCGHTANADVNAARNILRQGLPFMDVEDTKFFEASTLEKEVLYA